ncbi:MAG: DUF3500 domain-containing protein [Pseudomonadota bacterium]
MKRRDLLKRGTALGLAAALPGRAQAQQQDGTGVTMRERATAWLASLNDQQRAAALFAFDSRQRRAWNFMLGSRPAPGLALENMTAAQKDAALDLLATGTSALGLEKARNIMLQQDILRDEWNKGSADRNRERFSLQIYGTPSATQPWGWRWEGHHLSLTFTLAEDTVISTTPSAFSSEPNTVPSGPHRGLVVLKDEEALGRALFTDLTGSAREAALVWSRSPGNIQSARGGEAGLAAELPGIALGDLAPSHAEIAQQLLEVYIFDVLPDTLARDQRFRLAQHDPAAIRFAWGGADLDGSIYYRLSGAEFLIEFATLRNQPQHQHAVFHDTIRNFGAHIV